MTALRRSLGFFRAIASQVHPFIPLGICVHGIFQNAALSPCAGLTVLPLQPLCFSKAQEKGFCVLQPKIPIPSLFDVSRSRLLLLVFFPLSSRFKTLFLYLPNLVIVKVSELGHPSLWAFIFNLHCPYLYSRLLWKILIGEKKPCSLENLLKKTQSHVLFLLAHSYVSGLGDQIS